MEIKPGKVRGLIFFAETPHFYTALSIQGGLLEYRWMGMLSIVLHYCQPFLLVSFLESDISGNHISIHWILYQNVSRFQIMYYAS